MLKNYNLELRGYDREKFDKERWIALWGSYPELSKYFEAHQLTSDFYQPDNQLNEKIFMFEPSKTDK